jgi:hypothetical protein
MAWSPVPGIGLGSRCGGNGAGPSFFARIGRLFGGGGPAVTVAFEAITTARPTRARQTVSLARLDPGEYTLTLVIEDPAGDARHRRVVRFRVTGR